MVLQQALIIDSWQLSLGRIVAHIKHSLRGLPKGTILRSLNSEESWQVERVIFTVVPDQLRFEGEKESFLHIKFQEPMIKNMEDFIDSVKRNEKDGIYEYNLKANGETVRKPLAGEILYIECTKGSIYPDQKDAG